VAEGYRTGRFTKFQVRTLLRLKDPWETESWLRQHNLFLDQSVGSILLDAEISRNAREATWLSSQTPRP
jgi:hypothetical protein